MHINRVVRVVVATTVLIFGGFQVQAQKSGIGASKAPKPKKITQADRKAAASRVKAKRAKVKKRVDSPGMLAPGAVAPAALIPSEIWPDASTPPQGGVPDYFGPYSNWANSPLPKGSIASIILTNGGSGYGADTAVVIADAYGTGSGATASIRVQNGVVTGLRLDTPGSNYTAPAVIITGSGSDATATAALAPATLTGGMRKFVDTLPGLTPAGANNLGQYIPVAVPDTTTYPGSDYYEIELGEFTQRMHSALPPTPLRGYRQTNGPDPVFRYLGPVIVARKDRPVRIKFTNSLPTGAGGKLFLPVDTTIMGSGPGPTLWTGVPGERGDYICSGAAGTDTLFGCFTENRATLHLHGGHSPWISDGTPHQWIVPATENTPHKKGVSVSNVPDMPEPGDGSQTFYYTNQQSARLMFYHDHAVGITRLNVYVGEAAGYVIRDDMEDALVRGGTIKGRTYATGTIPGDEIPLIIQDKTFVDAASILATDPTWNWGTGVVDPATGTRAPKTGDLWWPHVYVPAQNPYDLSGVNAIGRWPYGPWFWPPTTGIPFQPVPNPYADPNRPEQPPEIPGTPNASWGAEAFLDTPVVNGTAYPTLTVQPKAYRFRILNASHDRFWNLQLYRALRNTEVAMVPAVPYGPYPTWPADSREGGVPDPRTAGPSFIQIGTEGGFLAKPAVIANQPITWNMDPTTFNFGNVEDHALLLAPAERADVIIDFSAYAGQTLILYNDAPAAFPALDGRLDYYTGKPDQSLAGDATGGSPTTYEGFGPNTRTVMQIRVAASPVSAPFDLNRLNAAFASTAEGPGVFEASQDPIIVAQSAYNSTYNESFPTTWPYWGVARIQDTAMQVHTVAGDRMNIPLQPKAIQDEMGEAFDEFGRMSAKLGLELPFTQAGNQNFVLQNFVDPPTEILDDSVEPGTPQPGDGTQIWKITHNGVDTHPVHFHLFDVQVLNRVGWDGAIRLPDPNELGWKDTVRVSPLEDTIVALRPVAPRQPFGVPDSQRALNPALPLGSTEGFTNLDPRTGQAISPPVSNILFNFGWEYVWHCHILSHEELDMMRPMVLKVARALPPAPVLSGTRNNGTVSLTWTDATPFVDYQWANLGNPANEIGFRIERAPLTNGVPGAFSPLASTLANIVQYPDATAGTSFAYRVIAFNAAGTVESNILNMPVGPAGPVLTVTPVALTFDSPVNLRTADQIITISNTGGSSLSINNITLGGPNPAQFQLTLTNGVNACGSTFPKQLAPTASCDIAVNFMPTTASPTPKTAVVNVAVASPAIPQPVALTGNVLLPAFGIDPAALSFSSSVGVESAPQTVTVSNAGTAPVSITNISFGGANPAQFAQANSCGTLPATLATGENCTVSVTFKPTTTGDKSATLVVNVANAPAQSVVLAGTVILPAFTLTPATMSFSSPVGVASVAQDATVTNPGPGPLTISSISLGGANPAQFAQTNTCGALPATLASGGTCTISVVFNPTTTGNKSATLAVNVANATAQSVLLSGTVVLPALTLTPATMTFSSPVGVASASQSATVANSGAGPLTITNISLGGANPAQFAQTSNCGALPAVLAANSSCTVNVTFSPTTTGTKTAALTVNVANATAQSVALTGNVLLPSYTLTPAAMSFTSSIGVTSAAQVATVANAGPGPLTINSIVRSGPNPAQFAHTTTCGGSLADGASCTISVTFGPTTAGTKTATLTVNAANVPAQVVALTGAANGAAPILTVTPAAYDFGNLSRTAPALSTMVTVQNTGTAPLTVTGTGLTNTNNFSRGTNFAGGCSFPQVLQPNASCLIRVSFNPPNASQPGPRNGTLTVNANAPATSQTVALSGNATL